MARRPCGRGTLLALAIAVLPSSQSLLVDGRLARSEWRTADAPLPPEGEVQVRREPGAVWVLVRTDVEMPVHLYRVDGDSLTVLHASASLGAARYRAESAGDFRLERPFAWQLRDPRLRGAPAFDLGDEQRDFLARERWVANTTWLGERGVVEVRLDRAWLEAPGVRWAVSYFARGDEVQHLVHFPPEAGLADPALERQLMAGDCPERIQLATGEWKSSPVDPSRP
jgi:hypothetical protein